MSGLKTLNRRKLLRAGATLAVAGMGSSSLPPAWAKRERRKSQAPGFFRFNLGAFEITMLTDGLNTTPVGFSASNIPEDALKTYLRRHYFSTTRRTSHLNVCLINTGDTVVMVDAGSGDNFRDTAGKLTASLERAGYAPEDIDVIVISHGHPDHIWGIIDDFDEAPRFPNARYVMSAVEWNYWTAEDLVSRMPEGFRFFATGAHRNLLPIADKTLRIKPSAEVIPGITTLDSAGHTPGHISVVVESEGAKLLVAGDTITHPFISLEHPEWQPRMDMEKETAVATRKRLLDMAASKRMVVASYHIPFPGVGHVARNGTRYRWVPLVWQWSL